MGHDTREIEHTQLSEETKNLWKEHTQGYDDNYPARKPTSPLMDPNSSPVAPHNLPSEGTYHHKENTDKEVYGASSKELNKEEREEKELREQQSLKEKKKEEALKA